MFARYTAQYIQSRTYQNRYAESIRNTDAFFSWLIESALDNQTELIENALDEESQSFVFDGNKYHLSYVGRWLRCYGENSYIEPVDTPKKQYEFIVYVYVIGVLCVLGLFGNVLAFVVLQKHEAKGITIWFLQALAVSDTGVLIGAALDSTMYDIRRFTDWLPSIRNVYPYTYKVPVKRSFMTSSTWLILLVTYYRYIAVCKPHSSQLRNTRQAKLALILIVLLAGLYNLPLFFAKSVTKVKDICGTFVTWSIANWWYDNDYVVVGYRIVCHSILISLGPCIGLTIINVKLIHALRTTMTRNQQMTGNSGQMGANITLMLVVVVAVYVVCMLPYSVYLVIGHVNDEYSLQLPGLYYVYVTSEMLMVLNSAINFLIYCLMNRGFQQTLKAIGCQNA